MFCAVLGNTSWVIGWPVRPLLIWVTLVWQVSCCFFDIDGGIVRLCPYSFRWNHQLMVKLQFVLFQSGKWSPHFCGLRYRYLFPAESTIFPAEINIFPAEVSIFQAEVSIFLGFSLSFSGSTVKSPWLQQPSTAPLQVWWNARWKPSCSCWRRSAESIFSCLDRQATLLSLRVFVVSLGV